MKRLGFNPTRAEYLTLPFVDKVTVRSVFLNIFRDYPPSRLRRLPLRDLDDVINEISNRDDVKALQRTVYEELKTGRESLGSVATIIANQIKFPKRSSEEGSKPKAYIKTYKEVEAYCNACSHKVAVGLLDRKSSLDDIVFAPGNILYPRNLIGLFPENNLACDDCGSGEFRYEQVALTTVYRDMVQNKSELEQRVRRIIQNVADKIISGVKKPQMRYAQMEQRIVDGFYFKFKDIKSGNSINYKRLYRLFEWIRRENIDIDQLQWIDNQTRSALKEEIFKNMSLPYAVIRARVKKLERMYEKVLEVLYDIRESRRIPHKKLRDVYAIRVILPTERDCYNLLKSLQGLVGLSVVEGSVEDNIRKPRKRGESGGYQALQLFLNDGNITYEVQIKTHEMDRIAETDPAQKHDEKYINDKRANLVKLPKQIRAVVAAVLGVYK